MLKIKIVITSSVDGWEVRREKSEIRGQIRERVKKERGKEKSDERKDEAS